MIDRTNESPNEIHCLFCASQTPPEVETCAEGWFRAVCARKQQCGARGSWELDRDTAMRRFLEPMESFNRPVNTMGWTFAGLNRKQLADALAFAYHHGWVPSTTKQQEPPK